MKKIFTLLSLFLLMSNLYAQNVYDLRDSTSTGVLQRALANNTDYPSGSTFILNNSKTYDLVSANITKSFVIKGDASTSGQPHISFGAGNSFNIATGGTIDSIKLVNVKLSSKTTTINTNGGYLFNNGSNVVYLKKVIIDNCKFRTLRGFVRLRTANSKIDSVCINNCVFDSIGGYNVVTAENLSVVKNIFVTNSTFSKVERLIRTNNANSDIVIINNCTFLMAPRHSYKLLDYGTGIISTTKTLTNCVFGRVWNIAVAGNGTGSVSTVAMSPLTNNFKANDFSQTDEATNAITLYDKSSFDFFTDTIVTSASVNLKIKEATFPGATSAGDPRWYNTGSVSAPITKNISGNIIVTSEDVRFSVTANKVAIYNLRGQFIKSAQKVNQISISDLKKGLYIIKITDINGVLKTQKFVK